VQTDDRLDQFIDELERVRRRVARDKSKQVRRREEVDLLRSTAYAWFQTHRQALVSAIGDLSEVDNAFKAILDATARMASRATYLSALATGKNALAAARARKVTAALAEPRSSDQPPDFGPLAVDLGMREILIGRWHECARCLDAGAHLAATVMMGGLLEALFVARANLMADKKPLFRAKATPIDKKTGKAAPLGEWTLRPYIDVGAEIGWITRSGSDVAAVLRDYRNYVHPEKQRVHGVHLGEHDSLMFWEVTKALARQLLASASREATRAS
jgi:hypothetical protein